MFVKSINNYRLRDLAIDLLAVEAKTDNFVSGFVLMTERGGATLFETHIIKTHPAGTSLTPGQRRVLFYAAKTAELVTPEVNWIDDHG